MRFKLKFWFILFIPVYLWYHLYTLNLNPLPWFDEVYYVSVAQNVMDHGNYTPDVVRHARDGKEALSYGPIYFYLTGSSLKMFGVNIFSFRIVNFVFGLLCVAMTFLLFRLFNPGTRLGQLLVVAMALDPFLQLSMHEARMDLMAAFFVLTSSYFLLKSYRRSYFEVSFWETVLAAVFAALAIMTTPRAAIIIAPVFFVFAYYVLMTGVVKKWKYLLAWVIPIGLLYSGWIFIAYGGFSEWMAYYQKAVQGNEVSREGFLWAPLHFFYVPQHEYLLIFTAAVLLMLGALRNGIRYFNYLIVTGLIVLVTYYIVIVDYGPYSVFILPVYYMIIFQTLNWQGKKLKTWNLSTLAFYGLLLFNLTFTTLKGLQVYGERQSRKPQDIEAFVAKNIGKNKKVVGDATYYYAVHKAGSELQLVDKYDELESRERKHRKEWGYDYLIVSDILNDHKPHIIRHYIETGELVPVARYNVTPEYLFPLLGSGKILSTKEKKGYSCTVYKRAKN